MKRVQPTKPLTLQPSFHRRPAHQLNPLCPFVRLGVADPSHPEASFIVLVAQRNSLPGTIGSLGCPLAFSNALAAAQIKRYQRRSTIRLFVYFAVATHKSSPSFLLLASF